MSDEEGGEVIEVSGYYYLSTGEYELYYQTNIGGKQVQNDIAYSIYKDEFEIMPYAQEIVEKYFEEYEAVVLE